MGKKNYIILLILLVSGLAFLVYILQREKGNVIINPYKAVPPDASLILETSDLPGFMNTLSGGKGLFQELATVKELNRYNKKVKFLADLLNRKETQGYI